MTDFIVSARKYRPSNFRAVVGQETLTNTLKNAIESKRLAQAYLFTGPRGVGKTSCARIFAKTINCLSPNENGEACGHCDSCRAIDEGNSFNIIELDAASNNSVDNIRKLTDEVNIPPQQGDYRVFIIDEVHMLSTSAFNAFLKTLEEPPKYVVFILATTEKHKVIPTILSRCQIYDFKRITIPDIARHLAYVAEDIGVEAEKEALTVIARKADGAMRDALSIFDQVAASSGGKITYRSTIENLNILDYDYYFRLIEAFRNGDVASSLLIFNEIRLKGFDIQFFINGLASHIRDLMVAASPQTAGLLEVGEDMLEKYSQQASSLPLEWFYAAMKILNDADLNYRTATSKQLLAEITLIRLCQLLKPPTPPFDRVEGEAPLNAPVVSNPQAAGIAPVQQPVAGNPAPPSQITAPQKPASQEVAPQPTPATVETKEASQPSTQQPAHSGGGKGGGVKSGRRRSTTRLSDLEEEVKVDKVDENKRKPVTDEDFQRVWREYIDTNPEKPILIAAMKSGKLERRSDEEYCVLVNHPAQIQAFESDKSSLVNFLRQKLENDFLTLNAEIDQNIKITKPLPINELFKDILENNPTLADFIRKIDPELL